MEKTVWHMEKVKHVTHSCMLYTIFIYIYIYIYNLKNTIQYVHIYSIVFFRFMHLYLKCVCLKLP